MNDKKLSNYNIGEAIIFYFLDQIYNGIIININVKNNSLQVKTKNEMKYIVYLSEKDSKFCFIKK